jgi:pyruvate,orthophosphate dikinase
MNSYIFFFGENLDPKIVGNKGAGLSHMVNMNLPVPSGFTLSTDLCNYYYKNNFTFPPNFREELQSAIKKLEQITGKIFAVTNSNQSPLLISARSGSSVSMPGMMETILNLGINDHICEILAHEQNNRNFALNSYICFLKSYASIVLSIDSSKISHLDNVNLLKDLIKHEEQILPIDLYDQLELVIEAILKSWMSARAITYRKIHNIDNSLGTAVNIQMMVFGNMSETSGTGVVFSRNPSTGEQKIFGEIIFNAQGEDIVSGVKTPILITDKSIEPKIFTQLTDICIKLEKYYKDVQDIEFTIEESELYILQTRNAQRTIAASIKIAVDMHISGLISKEEALMRIDTKLLYQLLHAKISDKNIIEPISFGIAASPGAVIGRIILSKKSAIEMLNKNPDIQLILARRETSAEDIELMNMSKAIITANGGATCHAAVVSRGMGIPAICGISELIINQHNKTILLNNILLHEGDIITIDGANGKIYNGSINLVMPSINKELEIILSWADEISNMKICANAETILDSTKSILFGAHSIGLCRTEHMFFEANKILLMRKMILATNEIDRNNAITELLPLQVEDFKSLFNIIGNKSINIRLLDPPLHEFLPSEYHQYKETNPMLGHRGVRLAITYPEIYEMQIIAIFTAAYEVGQDTNIEIMIPFVSTIEEIRILKQLVLKIADKFEKQYNYKARYKIGTMIELPRAAFIAYDLAKELDFFSFGTNDLTQTTFGISRDDGAKFINNYIENKIFEYDPFVSIDEIAVGTLMQIAIASAKSAKPKLKISVCGEHAGDPRSIEFFHKLGIEYISCSPYRIFTAKIASAQAKIKNDYDRI